MKARLLLVAVVAASLAGVLSPAAALSSDCGLEVGSDCCGLDCTLCLCCSHLVRPALPEDRAGRAPGDAGRVGAEVATVPRDPLPRDVLHVPRPSASR